MGWLDDLQASAEKSASNAANTIDTYLGNQVAADVIKIGDPSLGNLSALDIANGKTGSPVPIHPGQGLPASQNAAPYPSIGKIGAISMPILVVGGLVLYLLMKRA